MIYHGLYIAELPEPDGGCTIVGTVTVRKKVRLITDCSDAAKRDAAKQIVERMKDDLVRANAEITVIGDRKLIAP